MDAQTLASIANVAAIRVDVRIDESVIEELQSRLSQINSFSFVREALREQAVEAALIVLFGAASGGQPGVQLSAWSISEVLKRLCPLPPIC